MACALAAASLAFAPSASAGVPQKQYACYGETSTFISYLDIKSQTRYEYLGENGKYAFKSGPKVLKFENGPLKKWAGRLTKSNGNPAIKLVTDQAGGQTVDCYSAQR